MALRVWLPLNGNLENKGLSDIQVINNGATIDNSGKIGPCYSFDGTDDYISLSNLNFMPEMLPKEWTICFWVYNNDSGDRSVYFSNYQIGGVGDVSFGFEKTTGELLRVVYNSGKFDNTISACSIDVGKWTHLTISKDANHLVSVYKNGDFIASYINSNCVSNGTLYYLGRDNRTGATALKGKLNDFRIYDECLSPKRIKEISKGLVAHYKLEPESWNPNLAVPNPMVNGGATSFTFDPKQNMYTIISPVGDSTWGYGLVIGATKSKCIVPYNSFYRFSFEVLVPTEHILVVDYNNYSNDTSQWNPSGNDNDLGSARLTNTKTIPANTWTKCVFGSKNANTSNTTQTDLYENSKIGIRTVNDTESVTWYLRNFKFELGDTATDYVDFGYNPMDFITTDASGNGYNIFKTGSLSYNADSARYSSSLQFGGTCADYLYRPIFDFLKSPFTFNCWIYQTNATSPSSGNTGNTLQFIMGQGRDCGYAGFALCSANGYARLYLGTQTNGTYYSINDNTINLLNGWHMLTGTFDGSTAKLYIDGVIKGTKDSTVDPSWEATSGFVLGKMSYNYASATTAYFPFVGSISDSKVYATALSADEILTMYKTSGIIDNKNNAYAYEFKEE